MGNCQANDAAAAEIQHPDGSVERFCWPTSADEVMRSHPGYYVAQVTVCISRDSPPTAADDGAVVRFTRVHLLRHRDMLLVGQIYRLVSSQEVTKAVRARRHETAQGELIKQQKMQTQHNQVLQPRQQKEKLEENTGEGTALKQMVQETIRNERERERERQRSSRCWRPSLESISEAGS